MFLGVKNCLKLNPEKVLAPEKAVSPPTFPAVSPEGPLKAMSPPWSLIEKPAFIEWVTGREVASLDELLRDVAFLCTQCPQSCSSRDRYRLKHAPIACALRL